MKNFDLIMITTVRAESYEDACEWLRDFADGTADDQGMLITSEYPGMATELPDGQRLFALVPLAVGSMVDHDAPVPVVPPVENV